jgi:hypothetical protein
MTRRDDRGPAELLADRGWRLLHSLWLLAPIASLGLLTWAGFAYIGVKARRRAWCIAAIVYAVGLGVAIALPSGKGPSGPELSDLAAGFAMAVWIGGIVHGVMVNKEWLRWRAENTTPWYSQPAGGQVPAPSAPASAVPPQIAAMGIDPARYYSGPAGGTGYPSAPMPSAYPTPSPAPPYAAPARSTPAPAYAPPPTPTWLDINTADAARLGELPGMDAQRCATVLAERERRDGFVGIDDFAAVAGLAPHELVRLRGLVTFSPRPPRATGPGRVLDV